MVSQEMPLVSISSLENAGEKKIVVTNSPDASLCPEDNVHFIMPWQNYIDCFVNFERMSWFFSSNNRYIEKEISISCDDNIFPLGKWLIVYKLKGATEILITIRKIILSNFILISVRRVKNINRINLAECRDGRRIFS